LGAGSAQSSGLSAEWPKTYTAPVLALVVVAVSISALSASAPHFRLYTNALAGGAANAGYYFPHDEFYDASVRDVVYEIAQRAKPGAQVASETPGLAAYYAGRANRADLVFVSISDPKALKQLREGDFMVAARGRRYFSNETILAALNQAGAPTFTMSLGSTPSASIYLLDKKTQEVISETARRLPPLAQTQQSSSSSGADARPN